MATAAPELPVTGDQTVFNLQRWEKLCADPLLGSLAFRLETDAFGQIIMSPPPSPEHGEKQSLLAILLHQHLKGGTIITECPLSTSAGVKLIDVAWISRERRSRQTTCNALTIAPEICVEVLSPSNARAEIDEKKRLYFKAGAEEVWVCGLDGTIRFFLRAQQDELGHSRLAPEFPGRAGSR